MRRRQDSQSRRSNDDNWRSNESKKSKRKRRSGMTPSGNNDKKLKLRHSVRETKSSTVVS